MVIRRPQAVAWLSDSINRLTGAARQSSRIHRAGAGILDPREDGPAARGVPLLGYWSFSGVRRPALRAAFWLSSPTKMDLGMDGPLGLAGSGWLPFSDVIFGPALAVHPDLFLTPKAVNLIFSAAAVVVVYLLGRELFGRRAGVLTAGLFALLPWHVWLGILGMTAELPGTVLMTTFGLSFRPVAPDRRSVGTACLCGGAGGRRRVPLRILAVLCRLLRGRAVERDRELEAEDPDCHARLGVRDGHRDRERVPRVLDGGFVP